jgi:hypothetical protein
MPSLQEKIKSIASSLLTVIDASSAEELNYKAIPETWSILECVEHICLVNGNVGKLIQAPPPSSPPATENKPSELYSEGKLNHLLVNKREMKRVSPKFVEPKGIFKSAEEAKTVIGKETEQLLHVLNTTDIARQTHTIPHHALGEMTKTDWIHFMIAHTQRHLLQIEDIKNKYRTTVG